MQSKIVNGKEEHTLNKTEVRKLRDASCLVRMMSRVMTGANGLEMDALRDDLEKAITQFGAEHLQPNGELKISAKEQAVNDSVPG